MRFYLLLPLLALSFISYAQSDIDVVYLLNGTRYSCEIQQIKNDSISFTKGKGRHMVSHKYSLGETATYIVNNFYTTPGEELIKASRNLKFGAGIMLVGGTIAYIGRVDERQNLNNIGVGLAAVGSIICILGFNNFKKAGMKLNKIDFEGDRLIFKL